MPMLHAGVFEFYRICAICAGHPAEVTAFYKTMADYIKSIDPHHLVRLFLAQALGHLSMRQSDFQCCIPACKSQLFCGPRIDASLRDTY